MANCSISESGECERHETSITFLLSEEIRWPFTQLAGHRQTSFKWMIASELEGVLHQIELRLTARILDGRKAGLLWLEKEIRYVKPGAESGDMLLMAVVAAMVQEYCIMMRRILGQVVRDAPFPRNVRQIMLRRLDEYSVFAYM